MSKKINSNHVVIVFDPNKGKLRAKPLHPNMEGWIRFPRNLRIEGNVYEVPELREGKSGSWIACGGQPQYAGTVNEYGLKAA